jgi:kumamolisin
MDSSSTLVEVPHTHREPWPGARKTGNIDPEREVILTIWLRPKKGGTLDPARIEQLGRTPPRERTYLTRKQLIEQSDADPQERHAVDAFCARHKLTLVGSPWRSVIVSGPLGKLIEIFDANVELYLDSNQHHFRHRAGPVKLPKDIAPFVRGVFGFHEWPHSLRLKPEPPGKTPPLSAHDVATRYAFPKDADGTGQTIGILQLGGSFVLADFRACMEWQHTKAADPEIVRVDDAATHRDNQTGKDIELALDTQIVGALAPGAKLVIYDAPNNERGFLDAIRKAVLDDPYAPDVLSISFGWSERVWTPVALDLLADLAAAAALLGVTILCSSGDEGAHPDPQDKRLHSEAPASIPFVLACGATVIEPDSGNEIAWSNSTGGFSRHFSTPAWQSTVANEAQRAGQDAGRGAPDVAAQQDPGYPIVFDGVRHRALGTSAVAPMWAALVARENQHLGVRAGFFAPLLYGRAKGSEALRAITHGSNGAYKAHAGWNPCTGLGVPDAPALERALLGSSA